MKVWTHLRAYQSDSSRPLILALGNFDGVHRGHQAILDAVKDHARRLRGVPAVLTFSEHPQRVLHPDRGPALLTSPQHRLLFFSEKEIEICFLLPFTTDFARTDPEVFVRDWLVKELRVKEIHLGYNAHFGFERKGDVSLMKKLSSRLGFDFFEAEPVSVEGEFVSSSLIREVIGRGDFGRAGQLLGRPFSIFASVVRGKGRGKALGFPTANLRPHSEILPPRGVYPVEVREYRFHLKPAHQKEEFEFQKENPGPWWRGVLNQGVRPTFEADGPEVPEVHLLDGPAGDLLGRTVEVVFHPRLREEKQFEDADSLIRAIRQDISDALRYFEGKKSLQKDAAPLY